MKYLRLGIGNLVYLFHFYLRWLVWNISGFWLRIILLRMLWYLHFLFVIFIEDIGWNDLNFGDFWVSFLVLFHWIFHNLRIIWAIFWDFRDFRMIVGGGQILFYLFYDVLLFLYIDLQGGKGIVDQWLNFKILLDQNYYF